MLQEKLVSTVAKAKTEAQLLKKLQGEYKELLKLKNQSIDPKLYEQDKAKFTAMFEKRQEE